MRIGILTLTNRTNGYNYGAVFQCLALQSVLERYGHEVIVFDFKSTDNRGFLYKSFNYLTAAVDVNEFWSVCGELLSGIRYLMKRHKNIDYSSINYGGFQEFIKENLHMTSPVNENNIAEIADKMDAIIVGSDQVWSGFAWKRLVYLFDWEPVFKGRRISYAACSARKGVSWINRQKVANCMRQMDAISVRDIQTAILVRKTAGLKAKVVLDPTFLYDFDKYMEPIEIPDSYVLIYVLGKEINGGFRQTLQQIRLSCPMAKIVLISLPMNEHKFDKYADIILSECSAGQWLFLFANASFVLTDSFHGVCFSLKYKRNFLAYYEVVLRASRLLDLRNRFGLEGHIVASLKEAIRKKAFQQAVNYSTLDRMLEVKKQESLGFLRDALNE